MNPASRSSFSPRSPAPPRDGGGTANPGRARMVRATALTPPALGRHRHAAGGPGRLLLPSGPSAARAWRAVLMWRTSWMSREVILLPAFIALVGGWACWPRWRSATRWRRTGSPEWRSSAPCSVVLHRDDLCLHPLHPGMGASAHGGELRRSAWPPALSPPARWR